MNQTERIDISLFRSHVFLFSYRRQWRVGWKQPASVTVSPVLVPYGLAGNSCLHSMTLGGCWSTGMTPQCECWVSPTQPPGRQSWRGPVATARACALLTWSIWRTRPASADPPDTLRVQAGAHAPKTPAVRVCAVGAVTTQPCASLACPATARYAGAATWSVRHVSERRRCTPAKTHKQGTEIGK